MRSKLMGTMLAAFALTAGSVAAAQTAAPLSLGNSRAGAALSEASELRGPAPWIVGAIALGLIVWGIIEFTSDGSDAFPTSP